MKSQTILKNGKSITLFVSVLITVFYVASINARVDYATDLHLTPEVSTFFKAIHSSPGIETVFRNN